MSQVRTASTLLSSGATKGNGAFAKASTAGSSNAKKKTKVSSKLDGKAKSMSVAAVASLLKSSSDSGNQPVASGSKSKAMAGADAEPSKNGSIKKRKRPVDAPDDGAGSTVKAQANGSKSAGKRSAAELEAEAELISSKKMLQLAANAISSSSTGGAMLEDDDEEDVDMGRGKGKKAAFAGTATAANGKGKGKEAVKSVNGSGIKVEIDVKGKGRASEKKEEVVVKKGVSAETVKKALPNPITHPVPGDKGVKIEDIPEGKDTQLVRDLRSMVAGLGRYDRDTLKAPGNYLAVDCEMVGTGPNGSESSLARVSIVNYHGYQVMDTFVLPKERVTDWRTWVSGVRPKDMIGAKTFEEVMETVAKLVEGKILIGHAVENDTKAMLLSHPSPLLRDTQKYGPLRTIGGSKMPSLRKLTELELGLKIQAGAHSSVTDARATMALYRLHKTEWENSMWKETQAFLNRGKKGGKGPESSGSRPAELVNKANGEGKKRKAAEVEDPGAGNATKKAKKVNGSGSEKKAGGGSGADAGDWWLA